ncbi:hypothetical protein C7W88_12775 [Novosphingobium sp. THN1]|uniref:DUF6527 family protein n=1 Tax=Novosphingobium sp. THN1 TaxID=1016987 RepID=UPI000E4A185B|nr:DUF6527 family protein [Novosphingobium sp. THN1]AXU19699.1 hypothetical protein C7W88_12775 [Novosphingobium sp. THN1]
MTTVAPVNQRGSAPAVFVADFDDEEARVEAGHWHFYTAYGDPEQRKAGILFGCPCGCGSMFCVGFDSHEGAGPRWHWNGQQEAITLTPSILIYQMDQAGNVTGEHWHGFLTDGEFKSC